MSGYPKFTPQTLTTNYRFRIILKCLDYLKLNVNTTTQDIVNFQERKVAVINIILEIYAKLPSVEIKHVDIDTQKCADSKKNVDSNSVAPYPIPNQKINRTHLRKLKVSLNMLTFLKKK